jgi:hypothetical protein
MRTKGPNAKPQFSRNRLYRSEGFHCCLESITNNSPPKNYPFLFQGNIFKANCIWESMCNVFAPIQFSFLRVKGQMPPPPTCIRAPGPLWPSTSTQTEDLYVAITVGICVNRMARRLEGKVGTWPEGSNAKARGSCGGCRHMGFLSVTSV